MQDDRWLWLRKTWIAWRRLTGDDAYERYIAHLCATRDTPDPLSRRDFWARELTTSKVERCVCCGRAARLHPAANHARLKRLLLGHGGSGGQGPAGPVSGGAGGSAPRRVGQA